MYRYVITDLVCVNRGKVSSMPGNIVLMITKIRNISAPKVTRYMCSIADPGQN